jgi:hypothetical protein
VAVFGSSVLEKAVKTSAALKNVTKLFTRSPVLVMISESDQEATTKTQRTQRVHKELIVTKNSSVNAVLQHSYIEVH